MPKATDYHEPQPTTPTLKDYQDSTMLYLGYIMPVRGQAFDFICNDLPTPNSYFLFQFKAFSSTVNLFAYHPQTQQLIKLRYYWVTKFNSATQQCLEPETYTYIKTRIENCIRQMAE